MNVIQELKQLEKDRHNLGHDLTLYALIKILIKYFSLEEIKEREQIILPEGSIEQGGCHD
jgi:hypothetical protein